MKKSRKILTLVATVMCFLALLSAVVGCKNSVVFPIGSYDFQWDSAKVLSLGIDPYKETLNTSDEVKQLGYEFYYGRLEANQFPSMFMLLFPYCLFGPTTAKWAWMFSNVIFTIGIIVLLKVLIFDKCFERFVSSSQWFDVKDNNLVYSLFISALLIGLPWRNNIGNGQHTLFASFFFLLAVWLFEKNHDVLSGVALAISFFKYTLTVPLSIYFLYKKKYKAFAISIVIHIILTEIAAIMLHASFIDMIIEPMQIAATFTARGAFDIGAIFGIGKAGLVIAAVCLIGMAIYAMSGKFKGKDEEFFAILVMFSLVIVYHMIYDYYMVIIPVIVFALDRGKNRKAFNILLLIFTIYSFYAFKFVTETGLNDNLKHMIDGVFAMALYASTILCVWNQNRTADFWNNIASSEIGDRNE